MRVTAIVPLRVATWDELLSNPKGRYAHGTNSLIWCTRPDLCGLVFWGRVTQAELDLLLRVFDRAGDSGFAVPTNFALDTRRLEGFEPGAFDFMVQALGARVSILNQRARRQALVRGDGVLAAALAGFYPLLGVVPSSKMFDSQPAALAWLGEEDERVSAEVDRVVAQVVTGSATLDRLRTYLASRSGKRTSIDEAARWLGVSSRSLQRELAEANTSFRAELDETRLRLAKQLLLETDLKIAAIAQRVGSSTAASFIAFFRRQTKQSPTSWRNTSSRTSTASRPPGPAPRR